MGNHHSQTVELNPGWSQSFPRERDRKPERYTMAPVSHPAAKVLPKRIPGQKLRLTTNGNILQQGGTLRYRQTTPPDSPQLNSYQPISLQYDQLDGAPDSRSGTAPGSNESSNWYNIESDNQTEQPDRQSRPTERGNDSKPRSGSRKKSRAPPPPLTDSREMAVSAVIAGRELPPPPDEPPPPLPQETDPKSKGKLPVEEQSTPKRRLFKQNTSKKRSAARHGNWFRATSEDRKPPEMVERTSRAVSVERISHQRIADSPITAFSSLPRAQLFSKNETARSSPASHPRESIARSCSEGALQVNLKVDQDAVHHENSIDADHHKVRIAVSSNAEREKATLNQTPKTFYFGMEPNANEAHRGGQKRMTGLVKVKRNVEAADPVPDAAVSQQKRLAAAERSRSHGAINDRETSPPSESKQPFIKANIVERIPTRKLHDFMNSLERSQRKQLSISRDEILTSSSARSYKSQSSMLDVELELDEHCSISMHLRPTLPKKQADIPRFSPTSAWRSLNLGNSIRSQNTVRSVASDSTEVEEIEKKLLPINAVAKSEDSGISGDAYSPPPIQHTKGGPRGMSLEPPLAVSSPVPSLKVQQSSEEGWLPSRDIEISSGEDASGRLNKTGSSTPPKLTTRKSMFPEFEALSYPVSHQYQSAFSSLRQMKHNSVDGRHVDDNWTLSRSVPSSLHKAEDVLDNEQNPSDVRSDIGASASSLRHIMYLPKYRSVRVNEYRSSTPLLAKPAGCTTSNSPNKAPEKPPRNSLPHPRKKKFSYQSTVRLVERKRLEAQLNRLAEEEEANRRKEVDMMYQVEREFQKKRQQSSGVEQRRLNRTRQSDITQDQLQILKSPSVDMVDSVRVSRPEPLDSSPRKTLNEICSHSPPTTSERSSSHSPRETSDGISSHSPTSAVSADSSSDMRMDPREKSPPERRQSVVDFLSLPSVYDPELSTTSDASTTTKSDRDRVKPTLFSGVRNWIRGRRDSAATREESCHPSVQRQEPEGAPATPPKTQQGRFHAEVDNEQKTYNAKPNEKRKSIYKRVAEFTDDVSDVSGVVTPVSGVAPSCSSGPQQRRRSSGYESSSSASKPLEERRDYHGYRTPGHRHVINQPAVQCSWNPQYTELVGVSRLGRKSPSSIYKEHHSRSAFKGHRRAQSIDFQTDPFMEQQPLRPTHLQNNYRRQFALGSVAVSPPATSSLHETHSKTKRTARRNESCKRTADDPDSPAGGVSVHRGSADGRVRATEWMASTREAEGSQPASLPVTWDTAALAMCKPHPKYAEQRRGAGSRPIDNSPARYMYSPMEAGSHRPTAFHPPRTQQVRLI